MACKTDKRTIEGKEVFVRQWAVQKAMKNLNWIMSDLGSLAAPLIEGECNFKDILTVLVNVDQSKLTPLLNEFLTSAVVEGQVVDEVSMRVLFDGELRLTYAVFAFVCEVNFKSFFAEGQAEMDILAALKEKKKKEKLKSQESSES